MKKIQTREFEAEVLKSSTPVLVDFYTEACPPCRMVSPVLEEIEVERAGKLKVVKIDAAEDAEFTASFRITTVPTFVLYARGERIGQFVGARGKKELQRWIDEAMRTS